jgi:hypothetical protein
MRCRSNPPSSPNQRARDVGGVCDDGGLSCWACAPATSTARAVFVREGKGRIPRIVCLHHVAHCRLLRDQLGHAARQVDTLAFGGQQL